MAKVGAFFYTLKWQIFAHPLAFYRRNGNGFPETRYLCAAFIPIKGESRHISKRRLLKRLVFSTSNIRNVYTRRQGNGRCLRSCIHAASCASAHEVRLYIYLRGLQRCLSLCEGNAKA